MLFFVFESLTSTESNPPSHRIQNGTSLSFFFPSVARPSDGKKNTSLMTCSDEAQPVGRHATTNYTKSNLGPSVNLSFFLLSLAQCLLTMVATIFYKRMDTQSISVHHTRGYKRTYLKKKSQWIVLVIAIEAPILLAKSTDLSCCVSRQLLLRWETRIQEAVNRSYLMYTYTMWKACTQHVAYFTFNTGTVTQSLKQIKIKNRR